MDEQTRKRLKYSDKKEIDAETEIGEELDEREETQAKPRAAEQTEGTAFESSTEAEKGIVDKTRMVEEPKSDQQ